MELNWENAKLWQQQANGERERDEEPTWSWDCSFKLDYDGPLLSVSSRFYPSGTYQNATWNGNVHIYFQNERINSKEFNCASIDDLKKDVEEYVNKIEKELKDLTPTLIAKLQ